MEIKDRLNQILEKKFLTKAELSRLLPFSEGTINMYCSGKAKPGKKFLQLLQEKLNINPAWVINGTGSMELGECQAEPADKEAYIKQLMKEVFDLTDKEVELIYPLLLRDKESIKALAQALKGDSFSKERIEKLINN